MIVTTDPQYDDTGIPTPGKWRRGSGLVVGSVACAAFWAAVAWVVFQ